MARFSSYIGDRIVGNVSRVNERELKVEDANAGFGLGQLNEW